MQSFLINSLSVIFREIDCFHSFDRPHAIGAISNFTLNGLLIPLNDSLMMHLFVISIMVIVIDVEKLIKNYPTNKLFSMNDSYIGYLKKSKFPLMNEYSLAS